MSQFMDKRCLVDYASALEEERRKILVFHRELPLSLKIITHAIESCKQQIGEDTANDCCPVLEEFLPMKPASSCSEESHRRNDKPVEKDEIVLDKSPDWLRSVRLGNQDPEPLPKRLNLVRKPVAVNVRKLGGAFQPFEKEKHDPIAKDAAAASSTVDSTPASLGGGVVVDTEKDMESQSQSNQSHHKARRCWSPELHRRFLQTLKQLGGSHTATPKQIRELMKVDGLTNDEVKSHLQKYRLHTRRPTTTVQRRPPHFVVVGGIWVPPPEYAAAAASAAAAAQPSEVVDAPFNGVYAPVALLPSECISQHRQRSNQSNQPSHNDEPLHSVVRCSSSSVADEGATDSVSPNSSLSKMVKASSPVQ